MQHTAVYPHHGGSVGGYRVIGECPVTTLSSPHPSCDLVVRPFLTRDGVIISGCFGAGVCRGDGLGGFDQFNKLSIIGKCPEPTVKSRQAGTHGDGAARGVKVESPLWPT